MICNQLNTRITIFFATFVVRGISRQKKFCICILFWILEMRLKQSPISKVVFVSKIIGDKWKSDNVKTIPSSPMRSVDAALVMLWGLMFWRSRSRSRPGPPRSVQWWNIDNKPGEHKNILEHCNLKVTIQPLRTFARKSFHGQILNNFYSS